MGGVFAFAGRMAAAVIGTMSLTIAALWHHMTKDGHLAAAGRQGADEAGIALKAFPDAVQSPESNSIFHSQQPEQGRGQPAGSFTDMGHRYPSPSEIAGRHAGDRESFGVHGRQQEAQQPRSPSEILAARESLYGQSQHNGQVLEQAGPKPGQGWGEFIQETRGKPSGNADDGYQRDRNRNLPEEEREQGKERERDRGRER